MVRPLASAAALLGALAAPAAATATFANPIRKVVNMLQDMQAKVTEEGKKEQELYDKFMCYCKTSGGTLTESIESAKAKIEGVSASIEESTQAKAQTEAALKEHTASRDEAKETVATATALREKEAGAYAHLKSDYSANLAALEKAIAAIEKGMAGGFLQTPAGMAVRRLAMERADIPDASRDELLAFLSGSQSEGYAPQSGEIVGILKQIHDEMSGGLSESTTQEESAIKLFTELMAAKSKEIETLQQQIETEMTRVGELGVQLAQMSNDVEDTKQALAEDEKFKLELEKGCATKTAEWEEIKKNRAEELVALAETIKVLNDDDALELFKKTLPSASSSFIQLRSSTATGAREQALKLIQQAAGSARGRPELDLIALALSGKKVGFEKVLKLIDDMVANLKKEQADDDAKKVYCETQLDTTDDKKKELELAVKDSETAISEMEGALAALAEDLKTLAAGIKALDKSVAEATEQRKQENSDHQALMAADTTAKQVLEWAKNRLNKFYNPKLYKEAPKRQLSEEERISEANGVALAPTPPPGGIAGTGIGAASLVQIRAHSQREAPEAPPPTFSPYKAKSEQSNGVIGMIDLLIKDLDKEMQESTVMEKNAQAQYEQLMADAGAKRAADSKLITEKEATKASTEEALQTEKQTLTNTVKEHMATAEVIKSLHMECDWLMQHHETRKEARTSEIESLGNAKAVLQGADYSLVQTSSSQSIGFLSRRSA